jgi:metal-responsive CopG/Arc/MetJ family transcriptional regulator
MRTKSVKIAVSLPAPLYLNVEAVRKKFRRSRSTVVQDALAEWLRIERDAEMVRKYEAGYRRHPETRAEIAAARASAISVLSAQQW